MSMNKVILMGGLTKDPEVRMTTGEKPTAVGKFSIAVNRRFKREGQPDADFFNCTCFGKQAEFVEKYLAKGRKVLVTGRLETDNYTKQDGSKVYGFTVMVEDIEFADSKPANNGNSEEPSTAGDFISIPDGIVEDLPFN